MKCERHLVIAIKSLRFRYIVRMALPGVILRVHITIERLIFILSLIRMMMIPIIQQLAERVEGDKTSGA